MVLVGEEMEPEEGFTRVQVVYYLSRGGQLQQPHLVDVLVSVHSNGLYLRDVKRRLSSIRGKGMSDSFSWSCKRNYKNNFIWQDLADDDKILPLSDGELVLKGSELYHGSQEKSEPRDPENGSHKIKKNASKKFDFEAMKRSLDLESDKLQEQSDLAAALSLSLQLMNDKRFSKDKSMDLNQQVMNSLSQAKKSNVAEECLLDHSITDISSETLHSEESTVQKFSFNDTVRERMKAAPSASSSTAELDNSFGAPAKPRFLSGELPRSKEVSRELPPPIPRELPKEKSREVPRELSPPMLRDVAKERSRETSRDFSQDFSRESLRDLPGRVAAEIGRPDREASSHIPQELSRVTPRNKPMEVSVEVAKEKPSDAPKDSSRTGSGHCQEKMDDLPFIKTSNKSITSSENCDNTPFMLSPRRLMAVLSGPNQEKKSAKLLHSLSARSSAPSTTEDPQISIRISKQATCLSNFRLCGNVNPHATNSRPDSPEHPPSAIAATSPPPSTKAQTYWPRWRSGRKLRNLSEQKERESSDSNFASKPAAVVKSSFEFDMKVGSGNNHSTTQFLNSSLSYSEPHNVTVDLSNPNSSSKGDGMKSDEASSPPETQAVVFVKEVITQQPPSPEEKPTLGLIIDTENLPRVSISESISEARESTKDRRPDSPESPLKHPLSPVRTQLSNSPSFNKRIEDARARARSLVSKEIRSEESRSSKDLLKETTERVKPFSAPRSAPTRTKNGGKSHSGTFIRSPPRMNSVKWEDAPARKEFVNRDDRPLTAGRTNLDWEKTLMEVESLSLPPPDFGQILQECGRCGRTFKPDSLKIHMRGCRSSRRPNPSVITKRLQ